MRFSQEKVQPYLFHLMFQLFKCTLLLVAVQMVGRFFFIIQFTELVLLKKNLTSTLGALWLGLRFDCIPAAYAVSLPLVLTSVGFVLNWERYLRFLRHFHHHWMFLCFLVIALLTVSDLSFYSFFQEHINILFFGLWEDDTAAVLTSIYKNYNVWLWIPLLLACLVGVWWWVGQWFKTDRIDLFYAKPMEKEELGLVLTCLVVVMVFLGRGNLLAEPLSVEDAYVSEVDGINQLSINGVLAFNKAWQIRRTFGLDDVRYLQQFGYRGVEEAVSDIKSFRRQVIPSTEGLGLKGLVETTPINEAVVAAPPHVVVLVMESFGSMWWPHETELPFLDAFRAHTQEDYLFLNFLPSENGTIGSVMALATGLPLRPGARFISEGRYMHTPLESAVHRPYQKAGYQTRFLYGGKLGWRGLGSYLHRQGWDTIEGEEQLVEALQLNGLGQEELGHEWGLFDEYLYKYLRQELKAATRPQFFFVLTTTNHPPFETPAHFVPQGLSHLSKEQKKLFRVSETEALQRLRALQYSNRELGLFLNDIKSGELREKTVVAMTGDHSFWIGKDRGLSAIAQKYAVPFYLYLPSMLRPSEWDKDNWGSHIDVFPTLYQLTLSGAEYWGFGQSIFSSNGMAMNSRGLLIDKSGAVLEKKSLCWDESVKGSLRDCPSSEAHSRLTRFGQSQISLADEFLRLMDSGMVRTLP